MSMFPQSIVEDAIARACRSEFEQITAGLGPAGKAKLIDFALVELDKLRSSDQMPDYRRREVALFYALWYLPSQVNLAHRLLVENHDVPAGGNIIDFGAGPGTIALALAIASAGESKTKQTYIHEIDCESMGSLGDLIWGELFKMKLDGNELAASMADSVQRFSYPTVDSLQSHSRWRAMLSANTPTALAGLHVVYGANRPSVKRDLEQLWRSARPDWGAVTTADFDGKRERPRDLAFLSQPTGREPVLSDWGDADAITRLRKEIVAGLPPEWSKRRLLERTVTWQFDGAKPVVYVFPHVEQTESQS